MILTESDFKQIEEFLRLGRHLQAFGVARKYGPLTAWPATRERLLAARLADRLGNGRLGSALRIRAWRAAPQDPAATAWFGWELLDRRGAFFAWEHVRNHPGLDPAEIHAQVDWLALQACLARTYRHFDSAEQLLQRLLALEPENRWAAVERVYLLAAEDRFDEALAEALQVFKIWPDHPAAVAALAYMLGGFDRHEEAIDVLSEAAPRFECNTLWYDLALRQLELERLEAAAGSLERYAETSPLLDKSGLRRLAGFRSDVAYLRGERTEAIRLAEEAKGPFFKAVAENLRCAAPDAKRVLLGVPLVWQHHLTCGPATLTAIGRFWSRQVEHIEVAEAICYNGTSNHDERHWVEENGFLAREFTVTWDIAVALVDRGIPFTLATIVPGSGHLQAVVGYDEARRTLLIRDPSSSYLVESLGVEFLRDHQSGGPRGMVMIPNDQADLLAGLDLPDAAHYDLYNQLSLALARHDRAAAERCYQDLRELAAGHRITHYANWSLAGYDGNDARVLQAIDQLLALYPGDAVLLARKLSNLSARSHRRERQAILEERCADREAHPYFLVEYGWFLNEDDRQQEAALAVLQRAARRWPTDAGLLYSLGAIYRTQRRFEPSMEVYRLAACLSEKDEMYAQCFFRAARHLKRTAEALAFLESRFQRFGAKSGRPARTLFWAHEQLNQEDKGFAVVKQALELRPEDGALLLYAANAFARHGDFGRAEELLGRARDRVRPAEWLGEAATLAGYRNQKEQALGFWRRVLEIDPCDKVAHREVAQLLAETISRSATLEHLRRAHQDNPHDYAIHQLLIEWLRDESLEDYVAAVRRLVEAVPVDGWAHRELSIALRRQGKFEEAIAAADMACHLETASPAGYDIRGDAQLSAGQIDAARDSFREAIRQSVDCDGAIGSLLDSYSTVQGRREALSFVQQQLVEQVIFGDGLLAYRSHARGILEGEELLASLREALAARPDLWHAWSAVAQQLLEMGRLDEAEKVARQAAERFPLLPRTWLDLAAVHRARPDPIHETKAIERALQISPNWSLAARALADVHENQGDFAASRQVLERIVAADPLNAVNHGYLAYALWRLGEKTAALDKVVQTAQLDPHYTWAWDRLRDWSTELGCGDRSIAVARELTITRPGEDNSWLVLARALGGPEALGERLEALDKAIALNPRGEMAHDLKAALLSEAGRTDEALAACRPAVWGEQPPALLRIRAARVASAGRRVDEAVSQLKALTTEDPLNYSAWEYLADICAGANRHAEHLDAATHMHHLRPTIPLSLAYLGWALDRNNRKAEAKTYFRQAFDLDQDYAFAGRALFDLHLDDCEFDRAAEIMSRLKARVPGPYVTAREVQLAAKLGDFEIARAGFDELCARPGDAEWPVEGAATALAAAHEKQGDLNSARLVWERAVVAQPRNATSLSFLAHVLWKLDEKPAALDRVVQTTQLDPHYTWAWDRLRDWSAELGCGDRSVAAARELTEARPAEDNSWLVLAHALGGAEMLAGRLEAVDKAIALNPRNEAAYDAKATFLSDAGRFDEAVAACRSDAWGNHPPALLRIRAARATAAKGRVDEAIGQFKTLLAEEPQNFGAWQYLAYTCANANHHAEHLEAARHMYQIQPEAAISLGYLGWALERNDRKDEAKTHFRQAFDLDPDYDFAGMHLFDLHLASGETEAAGRALATLKAHTPGPYVTAREVQLAAKLGDVKVARAGFRELCARPDDAEWPVDAAAKALADQQRTELLDEAIRELLDQPSFHPDLGRVWLRHVGPQLSTRCQTRFVEQLLSKGEAGARAAVDLLNVFAKGKRRRPLLRFVRRNRAVMHPQTRLWGQAGYALSMCRAYRHTAAWLADYRSRPDAQPWMVFNLVFALQTLARDREAYEAARSAATLAAEQATAALQAMVAFYQALGGQVEEAARGLEQIDERALDTYERHVFTLAQALCTAGSQGVAGDRWEAALKHLAAARVKHPSGTAAARRLYRLTARRLARVRGGWRGLVWLILAPGPPASA